MICIFSSDLDESTTHVMKWLFHIGRKDVIRVNYSERGEKDVIQIYASQNDFYFQIDGRTIALRDIHSIWYRKTRNWMDNQFCNLSIDNHTQFTSYLNRRLKTEELKLSEYLNYLIEKRIHVLGSSTKMDLNKLIVLNLAADVGLLVPEFHISNTKSKILEVMDQSPEMITKAISDGLYLFEKTETNTGYFTYTEQMNKEKVMQSPEVMYPSLLQHNIQKKYELRIFFINDRCYSMAIFSQDDEQTKTDFRKYNENKPNRFVPFQLPEKINKKIKLLFKKLNLNTGSVDMIVDKYDHFFFLEINPVGQFGMVSQPCNYFLEKEVAVYLNDHGRKKQND